MPSESEEPDPSNETVSGAMPDVGVAVADAVGSWLTATSMVTGVDPVVPSSSVTVRTAV